MIFYEILDPYAAFGRICAAIIGPAAAVAKEGVAAVANKVGLDAMGAGEVVFSGWPVLIAAIVTLLLLCWLAIKGGRIWCNFCPVGTGLGFLAKKSLFRVRLRPEKCVACKRCQKHCKTGCIDIENKSIDNSRCVMCLDCLAACPKDALALMPAKSVGDEAQGAKCDSRRSFLKSLPLYAAATAWATPARAAGKYQINRPDVIPAYRSPRSKETPLIPPGSGSLADFTSHCVGCQLCVTACPNDVLVSALDGPGALQPGLSYERGYCRPNCTRCSEICPAGAIKPVSPEAKRSIRIGVARIDRQLCIIERDEVPCTACQRICPQQAITLIVSDAQPGARKLPQVDAEKCTGCGACEYICPARPLAAITITGLTEHEFIAANAIK